LPSSSHCTVTLSLLPSGLDFSLLESLIGDGSGLCCSRSTSCAEECSRPVDSSSESLLCNSSCANGGNGCFEELPRACTRLAYLPSCLYCRSVCIALAGLAEKKGVDGFEVFARTAKSHVHIPAAGQEMYVFLDRRNGGENTKKPRPKMSVSFFNAAPPHAG
jgi:hypothetical protein